LCSEELVYSRSVFGAFELKISVLIILVICGLWVGARQAGIVVNVDLDNSRSSTHTHPSHSEFRGSVCRLQLVNENIVLT